MVGQDLSPRKPAIIPAGDQAGIELSAAGVWGGNRRTAPLLLLTALVGGVGESDWGAHGARRTWGPGKGHLDTFLFACFFFFF